MVRLQPRAPLPISKSAGSLFSSASAYVLSSSPVEETKLAEEA